MSGRIVSTQPSATVTPLLPSATTSEPLHQRVQSVGDASQVEADARFVALHEAGGVVQLVRCVGDHALRGVPVALLSLA